MDMTEKIFELLGRKEFENALLKGQLLEAQKKIQELEKKEPPPTSKKK